MLEGGLGVGGRGVSREGDVCVLAQYDMVASRRRPTRPRGAGPLSVGLAGAVAVLACGGTRQEDPAARSSPAAAALRRVGLVTARVCVLDLDSDFARITHSGEMQLQS